MTMGMDLVLFILPSFIALEMRLILLTVLLMKILLYQFTVSMLVSDVPLVCWNSNLIAAIYHKLKIKICLQSPVLKVKSDSTMKWFKYVIINNGLLCVAFLIVLQK